jgi:hypothetical protein
MLRQLFTNETSASVVLVFEKKKWAGTLLRLSLKVLTSQLRIETVPEWVDDTPPLRTVSHKARQLLSHFQAPPQSSLSDLADITCFSDMEWKTAMLQFANILQNTPLDEVCVLMHTIIPARLLRDLIHLPIAGPFGAM